MCRVGSRKSPTRCQKYETGVHCRVNMNQKTRPMTAVTPMTAQRIMAWTLETVRRRRATAMAILAIAQVQT